MWSRKPLDCYLESLLLMVIDPLFKFSLFSFILLMINRLKSTCSICLCICLWMSNGKEEDRDRETDRKWERLKMLYSFHMFWPLPCFVYNLLASWRPSCLTQLFNFESPKSSKASNSGGFRCLFWKHPWLFLNILENCALICNYPMWWEGWWW